MTVTTKMTKRDRMLLVFLALFLLTAGSIWLIITPVISDIDELKTSINEQELVRHGYEYKISGIPDAEDAVASLTGEVLADTDYYAMLQGYEIDSLLTGAALSFGFDQTELRELTITPADETACVYAYLSDDKTELSGIYEAGASMRLYGTREKLQSFLDVLTADYTAVRVSAFSWSSRYSDGCYELKAELLIYMTDNADYIQSIYNTQSAQETAAEP